MTDGDVQTLIDAGWRPVRFESLRGGGTVWEPPEGGRTYSLDEALAVAGGDEAA